MRGRDAVGRTIVAVHQSRHYDATCQQTIWSLDSITLNDGTILVPHVSDDGSDYYVRLEALKS